MKTATLGLVLPVIFAIHNLEEYRAFEDFKKAYLCRVKEKFRDRRVFLYALIILTLPVLAICLANFFLESQTLQFITTIFVLALFINGMQHLATSLWKRKLLPGTISSLLLLLPYTAIYLVSLSEERPFTILDLVLWAILSLLVMFAAIHASLRIGYALTK